MSTRPDFYDAGALERVAINLFYGWGYNFYRLENQLRADDLLVRSRVGLLLGQARKSVEAAEMEYRREFLPPPSRERPRPDPEALAASRKLEDLARRIGRMEGQIRAQPAPEADRMTQRFRKERETLERLLELDRQTVGRAEFLRLTVEGQTPAWLLGNADLIDLGIRSIGESLADRQALLA